MLYFVVTHCSDAGRDQVAQVIADLSANAWRASDRSWVVQSEESACALRDRIGSELTESDDLIVALLAGHAAWQGFDQQSEDWLLANL